VGGLIGIGLFYAIALFDPTNQGVNPFYLVLATGGAVIIAGVMGYFYFVIPLIMGLKIKDNPRYLVETSWRVNREDITIESEHFHSRFDWDTFKDYLETGEHFLLRFLDAPNQIQIVPKRAFAASEDETVFRDYLAEKLYPVDQAPREKSRVKRLAIGVVIIIVLLNVVCNIVLYLN
jgi:hypothetical protein